MSNTFCKNCHRIPSQCVCLSQKELTDEEIVKISKTCDINHVLGIIEFARAVIKASRGKE